MPVHDGEPLVEAAVASFVRAVAPLGGEVLVVDDASTDATAERARQTGARVLRLDEPSGPYVARNLAWREARYEHLVFVDVRCRATPSWPASLLERAADPTVGIAAGDVTVLSGPTLAAKAAFDLQPLGSQHGKAHPFLPYASTCHLATRRDVLHAVGGFREVRAGGDADFSWRVQLRGLGSLVFADDAVLEWVPRAKVRDLLGQYRRYGESNRRLSRAYADAGFPPPTAYPLARVAAHELRGAVRRPRGDGGPGPGLATRLVSGAARLSTAVGFRLAERDTADVFDLEVSHDDHP